MNPNPNSCTCNDDKPVPVVSYTRIVRDAPQYVRSHCRGRRGSRWSNARTTTAYAVRPRRRHRE